jgi:hypothetical protein
MFIRTVPRFGVVSGITGILLRVKPVRNSSMLSIRNDMSVGWDRYYRLSKLWHFIAREEIQCK